MLTARKPKFRTDRPPIGRLTEEERRALLGRARSGDGKARELFINENLPLVYESLKYAKRLDSDMDTEDIVSHGMTGLIYATDHFDLGRKFKFSTYAMKCIIGFMKRGIRKEGYLICRPQHVTEDLLDITIASGEILAKEGEAATEEELSLELGFSTEKIRLYISSTQKIVPLNTSIGEDGDDTLQDFLPSPDSSPDRLADIRILRDLLRKAISYLEPREQWIVTEHYLKGRSFNEMAEDASISRQRIQGLDKEIRPKLRSIIRREIPEFFTYVDVKHPTDSNPEEAPREWISSS